MSGHKRLLFLIITASDNTWHWFQDGGGFMQD